MQGIRLDQHAIEIQAAQQFLEGCLFAGFVGVVGLVRQSDAERPGIQRDLGDKPMLWGCPDSVDRCQGSTDESVGVWMSCCS